MTKLSECDRLKQKNDLAVKMEQVNSLLSKVATEQAQTKRVFDDIEDYLESRLRQIARHKHNAAQAQSELKIITNDIAMMLPAFLG